MKYKVTMKIETIIEIDKPSELKQKALDSIAKAYETHIFDEQGDGMKFLTFQKLNTPTQTKSN